jgi:outer membrane immunogenic protein
LVGSFEADIQGTSAKSTDGSTATFAVVGFGSATVTTNLSVTKELDYFGTVRGRLGWLATPSFLIYGTGGLAYGGVKASTNISQTLFNFGGVENPPNSVSGISQTRTGWTAGGGFEWMLAQQWSFKAEYLYYDLGSVTYNGQVAAPLTSGVPPTFFINNVQTSTRFNGNIVRVGLNYHF